MELDNGTRRFALLALYPFDRAITAGHHYHASWVLFFAWLRTISVQLVVKSWCVLLSLLHLTSKSRDSLVVSGRGQSPLCIYIW